MTRAEQAASDRYAVALVAIKQMAQVGADFTESGMRKMLLEIEQRAASGLVTPAMASEDRG